MSHLKYIKHDINDGVATLTLDRPKHNVLNIEIMNELNGQLETLTNDGSLKCVVLAANGPSWCAGVEVADHKPEMVDEMIATFNRIFELVHRMAVPTIAAVHGACLGGGMEVAMACDIIAASPKAVFGQPEIKLGFFPPYAAIRLPQLVGPARAVEICTTGRRYKAEEAHRMGLVAHLSGEENFQETVDGIVNEIKACSPLIIRLNKRAVNVHLGLDLEKALSSVSDLFLNTLMKTEDTLEGIKSFEEKRRPVWKNR
ncbi:MAG: enoyl-CoA hydratase/isomerase family protein [Desulfosarcina sp.]|nr:enoyl-CoA hydratase/isomerase family protein [Desulfosarcina sp.]MBC2744816.1 enoyl-CoA hydratase/isomerase family protein [Desulfosarcina sp.]MBC2767724.1 enoyl-CoA hydratase/isomerase family protein [Desulfosarcina sp.]